MQHSWFPAHKRWQRALSAVSSGFVGRMETNARGDPGRLSQCVCVTTEPGTEHPKGSRISCPSPCVPEQLLLPCGAVCLVLCGHRGYHPAPHNCPAFGTGMGSIPQSQDTQCAPGTAFVPFGNTELSICVQLGGFPALAQVLQTGSPWSRSVQEQGGFSVLPG